ncbi:hypothetical protein K438DRAFT_1871801, partial [Mycena galopus ATCC 62051]
MTSMILHQWFCAPIRRPRRNEWPSRWPQDPGRAGEAFVTGTRISGDTLCPVVSSAAAQLVVIHDEEIGG